MKIYTGYFVQIKKYQSRGYICISIARFNQYFSGLKMLELAPTPEMLSMSEQNYTTKYNKILASLSATEIMNKIRTLTKGKDAVLLCYEKEGKFCHRRLVAEWLKKEAGEEVIELGDMKQKSNQIKLF